MECICREDECHILCFPSISLKTRTHFSQATPEWVWNGCRERGCDRNRNWRREEGRRNCYARCKEHGDVHVLCIRPWRASIAPSQAPSRFIFQALTDPLPGMLSSSSDIVHHQGLLLPPFPFSNRFTPFPSSLPFPVCARGNLRRGQQGAESAPPALGGKRTKQSSLSPPFLPLVSRAVSIPLSPPHLLPLQRCLLLQLPRGDKGKAT